MLTSEKKLSIVARVSHRCAPAEARRSHDTLKNCNNPRSQLSENHTAAPRRSRVYAPQPSIFHLSFLFPYFFIGHKRFLRCISWGSCRGIKLNIIVEPGKEYDAEFRRSASDIWEEYMRVTDKSFNSRMRARSFESSSYLASRIAEWNRVRPIESAIKYFRYR